MRLGLNLGYTGFWRGTNDMSVVQAADRLGYVACWISEAHGSDAATVLAFVAARTRHIDIGASVFQIPARTPAMTAMTAATLDQLSEGRFRLGLGVSGPLVSEGWYGVEFDRPLTRTREYVEIVRKALARERVTHEGTHWTLPLPGSAAPPLRLSIQPVRARIPLYIAALGPKNLELTGRIADGWLGMFFVPEQAALALTPLRAGRASVGKTLDGFDITTYVPLIVTRTDREEDIQEGADRLRAATALYVGGMGSKQRNFYHHTVQRMGFEQAADEIQGKYLAGDRTGAAAAVPHQLIDSTALIGTRDRIADRLRAYADAGVSTVNLFPAGRTAKERVGALSTAAEAMAR
ncbi:LLM class F420-dependent oxidoreductase [Streptomyces boncukensis]|uniref:LLM class F420-dependent oxidoreductase n=1 Tax=Streptomyces boncukensis TaxID=2711219 RepID=A0A6G4WWC5_9ACTN|nr:LLM class F420-dependent oxidoreductase [Streptomyces boncukensis]NGO69313.1 LLM class F420-dependent oxidoreductase [Streptomyces boncukensis]